MYNNGNIMVQFSSIQKEKNDTFK